MATATYSLTAQGETTKQAIAEVKKSVQEFVSSTHPAALIAWGIVGIVILAGLVFTGWHTINLFQRGANTEIGKALAIIPALALDGSIALLIILLLTYFKDHLQWWLAVIFNGVLFIVVAINTSLDGSLNAGEPLTDGMRSYLRWGIYATVLAVFAVWEVLIHADPKHRQKMRRAKLEMKAQEDTDQIELELIELDIADRRNDLEYKKASARQKHERRMKALQRTEIDEAWNDFEDDQTQAEAERIREAGAKVKGQRTRPKAQSQQ
jgi:hypothetical protein